MNDITAELLSEQVEEDITFQLAYNGADLKQGSMSVKELAPALLALSDLIERSNEILNGDQSQIDLRVLAEFESGSFDVNFVLHHSSLDTAAAMLPAIQALSPKQILDIALGTYKTAKGIISGAAKLYKALHGEKPKEIKNGDQIDTRIVVFGNNNTIITDANTAKLYQDDRVRNALARAGEPLKHAGIDSMSLKRDDEIIETLEPNDIGPISAPEFVDETKAGSDDGKPRDIWVRVVKPNFDGGRWSFHDGSAKFGAELEDKDFQAKVNRREQGFYKGDTFLVRLRSIQHIDKNGVLTTRNIVEKILDQREGPRQQRLLPS